MISLYIIRGINFDGFGRNSQLSKWEKRKRGRDRAVPIKHSPRKRELGRYLGHDKYKVNMESSRPRENYSGTWDSKTRVMTKSSRPREN